MVTPLPDKIAITADLTMVAPLLVWFLSGGLVNVNESWTESPHKTHTLIALYSPQSGQDFTKVISTVSDLRHY